MAPSAIESVDEPDLVARQLTWLAGAVTFLFVGAALAFFFSQEWLIGLVLLAAGSPLALLTYRVSGRGLATVRLDTAGIHRRGGYDWSLPWEQIKYAAVHPYDTDSVLVVVPKEEVKHWSRTWRSKEQVLNSDLGYLPEGGYVVPIYSALAEEIENYIAGHLPGHTGFDPARLSSVMPAKPAREIRNSGQPPLLVETSDPAAGRQVLVNLALMVLAAALAFQVWGMGNSAGTLAIGVVVALFAWRAYSANSARRSAVLIADDGIRRSGRWGWFEKWSAVQSAEVAQHGGRSYLVLLRKNENAPYHRSATTLAGHPFPGNALVAPIADERSTEVAAAIAARMPD